MSRYLVGIPCLHGVEHTREAIESAFHFQSDVLVIDNGASEGVKGIIKSFGDRIKVIVNEKNIYVNPAWNQILKHFMHNMQYTHVVIFNSDAILPPNWPAQLDKFYKRYGGLGIPVPYETQDKRFAWQEQDINSPLQCIEIKDGIRGTCIILTRQQVNWVYPIPDEIKVWFGDNWIYDGLRRLDFSTYLIDNIIVYHALSQNVSICPDAIEEIEGDKAWWESYSKQELNKFSYGG